MNNGDEEKWIEERLKKLSERTKNSVKELRNAFDSIVEIYKNDPQLQKKSDLYKYALEVLISRTVFKPSLTTYKLVLFGDTGKLITRSNRAMRMVFGYGNIDGKNMVVKLIFREDMVDTELDMMRIYECSLSQSTKDSRIMFVTKDSTFALKQPLMPEQQRSLLAKMGFDVITSATARTNISAVDGNGRTDAFDMKIFEGTINQVRSGMRSNGTQWTVYDIVDSEISEASIIEPLTVWVPQPFAEYSEGDRVCCVGTTKLMKRQDQGEYVVMNAVSVIPIVVMHEE